MSVSASVELAVELLGPPRVTHDGADVDLGGPKPQAVVAVLALAAGRPCSGGEIAAALWGDDVPPSAAGTLRAYLSRLRGRLPDGALEHSAAGWRLAVTRDQVDALRAADLVAAAEGADAGPRRALLEQALGLWRGEPLAGLSAMPFAAADRRRLDELRADAAEALLDLRLAAGEHREAVADAAALVARYPHREGPVRGLALALARSGRQGDALAELDRLRVRLADDLGLDPSPATVDLHRRLLLHDPALLAGPTRAQPATAATGPLTRPALPLPLTSFVGRDADVTAVHDALGAARLVTLAGPGGAGKTRLALEALRRLPRDDVDGPWLVELGDVPDASRVLDAVAQSLGLTTSGAATPQAIADAVRGRPLLLVLDNCEHVVEEVAGLVAHLLATCGGVQVLATSREVLGVPGERVLAVEPLRPGRPGAPGEAELLFAERAASVVPGFRLDAATGTTVSRLVRALDGIPLALELAAARLAVMGLDDMLAMIGDRFALLDRGARGALPHQRTLETAVAWSYDLLDDDERRLFTIAATFAGPFTLAALRGVAGDEVGRPVIGVLASLTAKSMVQVDRSDDPRETRSYRLLETMRAFGRTRTDPATRDRLAGRHAAWFAGEAAEAWAGLRGPGAKRWLTHLDLVRPDLRAALQHAVDHGDRALTVRLVAGLGLYWFHRGHLQEALGWLTAARSVAGTADAVTEARAAVSGALVAYALGDASALDPAVLAALGTAAATDADPSAAAVASVYAGYFEAAFGRLELATGHFTRAGALVQSGTVEPWVVSEVLFAQGQLLRAQGRRPEALEVLRASAQVGDTCGHVWAAGSARYIAAKVHLDDRRGAAALDLLAQALPSTLDLGIRTSTLAVLHVAAAAMALVELHADGAALLGAVDAWGERVGYHPVRMDPHDAEHHRALVRQGLAADEFEDALRRGRTLALAAASERVRQVAAATGRRAGAPV